MTRQHAVPIYLPADSSPASELMPLVLTAGPDAVSEAAIQQLIFAHPSCLPIREIDPLFCNPVPLCMELNTPAGPIDALMVTASDLPVLIECKLWRNPEGRREVVGQILDYAKELSRWSSSDLQREVSRRLKREGNALLELVRDAGHEVEELEFNDALSLNLRRGRFLLLIVGDGIRENVEAIAEYLQSHAGLHFTLGLVEMPIYASPGGHRIVVPRVMAKTVLITREVISAPSGFILREESQAETEEPDGLTENEASRRDFMLELVAGLTLDDPDQPTPRVSPKGWLFLYMPAPVSSCWIGVLDKRSSGTVGIRLSSNAGSVGEAAIRSAIADWESVAKELGGCPRLEEISPGRFVVEEFLVIDRTAGPENRDRALEWLRHRLRDFVSVFRPRIRDAVEQLTEN